MADEKEFAKDLKELITRYIDSECDPQDIADGGCLRALSNRE